MGRRWDVLGWNRVARVLPGFRNTGRGGTQHRLARLHKPRDALTFRGLAQSCAGRAGEISRGLRSPGRRSAIRRTGREA
jgi:hypothetical protein